MTKAREDKGIMRRVIEAHYIKPDVYRYILLCGHEKYVRISTPSKRSRCGQCVKEGRG